MMKTTIEALLVLIGTLLLLAWLAAPDVQADGPQSITKSLRNEFACPGMHAE